MKFYLKIVFVTLTLYICNGCTDEHKILFATHIYNDADCTVCKANNNPKYEVVFPQIKSSPQDTVAWRINKAIQQKTLQIIGVPYQSEIKNALLQSAENSITAYPEFASKTTKHELYIEASPNFYDKNLISFKFVVKRNSGGAKSYTETHYLNFNLKTGYALQISGMISNKPLVRKAVLDSLTKKVNSQKGSCSAHNKTHLPQNIGLSKEGVQFCFNSNDLNCHIPQGVEITLPWDWVRPYISI